MPPLKAVSPQPVESLVEDGRVVSLTRQVATSRARRRIVLRQGNPRSLRHGVYAITANLPDASVEIGLTFEAHPDLDPILDARLVETYALTSSQWRRSIVAIEKDGWSQNLTKAESNLGARVERLERALQERVAMRRSEARRSNVIEGRLSQYEQPARGAAMPLAAAIPTKPVNDTPGPLDELRGNPSEASA